MIHDRPVPSEAVRELQNALRILTFGTPSAGDIIPAEKGGNTESVPLLVSDGFFGEETAEAVRAFQREAGLPVTGNADRGTWDALMRETGRRRAARLPGAPVFPVAFPSALDDPGRFPALVSMIQLLLCTVSEACGIGKPPEVTGEYRTDTAAAVAVVQQLCGLTPTGYADLAFWNGLAALYGAEMKKMQSGIFRR